MFGLSLSEYQYRSSFAIIEYVLSVRVPNLGHDVVFLFENVISDSGQVGILEVSVEVDLDNTVADGVEVLLLGGAGAAVED